MRVKVILNPIISETLSINYDANERLQKKRYSTEYRFIITYLNIYKTV